MALRECTAIHARYFAKSHLAVSCSMFPFSNAGLQVKYIFAFKFDPHFSMLNNMAQEFPYLRSLLLVVHAMSFGIPRSSNADRFGQFYYIFLENRW